MSQLLIVDIQDKVFGPIPGKEKILQKTLELIQAAKVLEIPITVSEHYPNGLGQTVAPLRAALGEDAVICEKLHFSGAKDEKLRHRFEDLRDTGRGQVIVAGIEAHVCVMQTALNLIAEGFELFIAADAVGSRKAQSCELALARIRQAGAVIVDSEMVIFEWAEKAGTAEFKSLLSLLKSPPTSASENGSETPPQN
jgi:nicotinamidase-related amidase